MSKRTNGWAGVGIGLIIVGAVIYGAVFLVAGGVALASAGPISWSVLVVAGPSALGFLILIAKVIVDRIDNKEDAYYSKNVDL